MAEFDDLIPAVEGDNPFADLHPTPEQSLQLGEAQRQFGLGQAFRLMQEGGIVQSAPYSKPEESPLRRGLREAAGAFTGSVIEPQARLQANIPEAVETVGAEALKTIRDVVSPTTYLPESEQAKLRPFVIAPEGIRQQTAQEAEKIQPGRSILNLAEPPPNAPPNVLRGLAEGATTPGALLTLPFAETRLGAIYFGLQGAQGLTEAATTLLDPKADPESKRKALESAPLSALMLKQGLTKGKPNALKERNVKENIPVERTGDGEVRPPVETGGGGGLQSETGVGQETPLSLKSEALQASADAVRPGLEFLRNSGITQSLTSKGYSSLNAPSRKAVYEGVLTAIENPDIFRSIIASVPVDVMNDLIALKGTPKDLFSNNSVLIDYLSSDINQPVKSRVIDVISRGLASDAAKVPSAVSRLGITAIPEKSGTAVETGKVAGGHPDISTTQPVTLQPKTQPTPAPLKTAESEMPESVRQRLRQRVEKLQLEATIEEANKVLGEHVVERHREDIKRRSTKAYSAGQEAETGAENPYVEGSLESKAFELGRQSKTQPTPAPTGEGQPQAVTQPAPSEVTATTPVSAGAEPAKPEPTVTTPVTQPATMTGAAYVSELPGQATALMNAVADVERAGRGLPEATPTQKRAIRTSWALADHELKADPKLGETIISELKADESRGVTDVEQAVLLRHKVTIENALNDAAERTIRAKSDVERAVAQDEHARLSDQLLEFLDTVRERGSQWGREGRWRQVLAAEDFSLPTMEVKMRQALGGRRLTGAEHQNLTGLNEQLKKRVAELEEAQAKAGATGRETDTKGAVREVADSASKAKPTKPPEEELVDLKAKVAAKLEKNEKASLTPWVKKIAEQLWLSGIKELNPMIDALHGILGDLIPGITRIETMDALSGRGQFSLPNAEAVKVAIRDLSAQSRLAAHIEDVQSRKPLPRTGPQRDKPTAEQRRLTQQLNELMRKFGVRVTDPASQLASALSAAKTWTRNRIADLKAEITARERIVKTRTPLQPDAELEGMRAELETVKAEHEQILGKPGQSLESQKAILERQIAELQRRITEGDIATKPALVNRPADPLLEPLKQRREALSKRLAEMRKKPEEQRYAEAIARKVEKLNKAIAEREAKLAAGDLSAKAQQVNRPLLPELEEAKQRLEGVNQQIEAARKAARAKTPAQIEQQRIEVAGRMLDRHIDQLEKDIEAGRLTPEKKPIKTPETPELLEKRAWLKALQEYRQDLRDAANPKLTPEERALKMVKTRVAKRIAELESKMSAGDFTRKTRKATPLDQEALRAKANLEAVKRRFEEGVTKAKLEGRSMRERVRDFIVRWRREFALSGITSIFKLTAAAIEGLTIDPIKESIGAGIAKALPGFRSRLDLEAPSSVGIEAKAWVEAFNHIMDDTVRIAKTGKTDLEFAFGGRSAIPIEMQAYMGRLHAILKAPLKRQAWTRAVEVLARDYKAKGIDTTDPLVQMQIGNKALRQAERALFLEDNMVVDAYKRGLSRFEPVKPGEKPSIGQVVGGTAARVFLPIVKIPTNLVARTFQAGFGGFVGAGRLAVAYAKGIETLRPEQADAIIRQLKAGSVGGAIMLLGFSAPQMFGGYYQPREKRKPGELKPGHTKLFGVDIPPFLQHRPELQIAQFGATVRRVMEERISKDDPGKRGLSEGAMAASLGLIEEAPFVNEMLRLNQLREAPSKYAGALGASIVEPQLIQDIAKYTDTSTQKRVPQNFKEQLEMGVPGLRQNVRPKATKRPSWELP